MRTDLYIVPEKGLRVKDVGECFSSPFLSFSLSYINLESLISSTDVNGFPVVSGTTSGSASSLSSSWSDAAAATEEDGDGGKPTLLGYIGKTELKFVLGELFPPVIPLLHLHFTFGFRTPNFYLSSHVRSSNDRLLKWIRIVGLKQVPWNLISETDKFRQTAGHLDPEIPCLFGPPLPPPPPSAPVSASRPTRLASNRVDELVQGIEEEEIPETMFERPDGSEGMEIWPWVNQVEFFVVCSTIAFSDM